MAATHFEDPGFAERYVKNGPKLFVPAYEVMQRMAAQLLAERAPADGRILVLGAGGGLELKAFAELHTGWRFVGVDPSTEMLAMARQIVGEAASRVDWVEGYIADAPAGPFDGATCLLTLHFLPDDGAKLDALRQIRKRLKPGAPFALADLCLDKTAADYDFRRDRYAQFALNNGGEPQDVADTRGRLKEVLNTVTAERDEALLAEAGFTDIDLFYAGLAWRGWIASA